MTVPAPKRVVEGVVVKHSDITAPCDWWSVDSAEDGVCSDAILEDFEGKHVRLTVEVAEAAEPMPHGRAVTPAMKRAVAERLLKAWKASPHMRLGQFISAALALAPSDRTGPVTPDIVWNAEDEALACAAESFEKNLKGGDNG